MRFLKIFLVCFFSLIGLVGGVVGVMYVAGALDAKNIKPENISFESTEFNEVDNFLMTIGTSTENVTATKVTLSFPNESTVDQNGYINNSIISVPKIVNIGQPFEVKLIKSTDGYNVGGQSVLTATSESQLADYITTNINIDVPVESISVKTYNFYDLSPTPENTTSFSKGTSIVAEAQFFPERSIYKFGDRTKTKKVYFDISTLKDGILEVDEEKTNELTALEQNTKIIYKVNNVETSVNIDAYTFRTSVIENLYANYDNVEEEIIGKTTENSQSGTSANLTLTNEIVGSFSVKKDKIFSLIPNQINRVYANSTTLTSFEINISNGEVNALNLNHKIPYVGIRAFVGTENNNILATDSQISFLNIDGRSKAITKTYNDKIYYMPIEVLSNPALSYWNIVSCLTDTNIKVFFEFHIFDEGFVQEDSATISTLDNANKQTWSIADANLTNLNWDNITENLVVVDGPKVVPAEYDLENNLTKTLVDNRLPATYKELKYIAYSDELRNSATIALIDVIKDAQVVSTTYYDSIGDLRNYKLYEVNSFLKVYSDVVFKVMAVILTTDYFGNIIVSNPVSSWTAEPLEINVTKTIKDLKMSIEVNNSNLLKNKDIATELEEIAFIYNPSTTDAIFDVVFEITATGVDYETALTNLKKEINIFKTAYNNQKISLSISVVDGNSLPQSFLTWKNEYLINKQLNIDVDTLTYPTELNENNELVWTLKLGAIFDKISLISNYTDRTLNILWTYEKTDNTITISSITDVNFVGDLEGYSFLNESNTSVNIDIYDGKASSVEYKANSLFNEETPIENKYLQQTFNLDGTLNGDVIVVTTTPSIQYSIDGVQCEGDNAVVSTSGEFIKIFKDKYGNILTNVSASEYTIPAPEEKDGFKIYKVVLTKNNNFDTIKVKNDTRGVVTFVGLNNGENIFEDVTSSYTSGSNFDMERFATLNSNLQINGINGLLKVLYLYGEQTYDLSQILNYNLRTSQLSDAFSVTNDANNYLSKIGINKDLNQDTIITVSAIDNIGDEFNIVINFKYNLDISLEYVDKGNANANDQGAIGTKNISQDGEDPQNENYYIIYTDNLITFKVNTVFRSSSPVPTTLTFSNKTIFGAPKSINIPTTSEITFTCRALGYYKIVYYSGEYTREFNILVKPNLALQNSDDEFLDTDTPLEKNITIESASVPIFDINNDCDFLIRDNDTLAVSQFDVSLKLKAVYFNNQDITTSNMFAINDYTISRNSQKLKGNYIVFVDVYYLGVENDSKIGTIKVNVYPNITQKVGQEAYFTNYYGKTCLLLTSGTTYALNDLKNAFNNVNTLNLINNDGKYFNYSNNNYIINNLIEYVFSSNVSNLSLTLENETAQIEFPVLISPMNKDFVQYSEFENINNDLGFLSNSSYLAEQNICDKYLSGTVVSLYAGETKNFGISPDYKTNSIKFFTQNSDGIIGEEIPLFNIGSINGELLTLNTTNEDTIVLVGILNQRNEILGIYRINILANCSLNIYYPYLVGEFDTDNSLVSHYNENYIEIAEYLYEEDTIGSNIELDLNEDLSKTYPNSKNSKRLLLQKSNNEEISNYTLAYSINLEKSLINNAKVNSLLELSNTYGISLTNGILSITKKNNPNRFFQLVINVTATCDDKIMDTAEYNIVVNSEELSKYKLQKNNTQFVEQTATVASESRSYDLQDFVLKYSQSSQNLEIANIDLQYFAYILDENGKNDPTKNINEYLTLTETSLSLAEDKQIVSDLKVKLIFYVIYGVIHELDITYSSNIEATFIEDNNIVEENKVIYDAVNNIYKINADVTVDLKNIFSIDNLVLPVGLELTSDDFSYDLIKTIPNKTTVSSGDTSSLFIPQDLNNSTYLLKITVKLNEIEELQAIYLDNYVFEISLQVLESLKSNSLGVQEFIYKTTEDASLNYYSTEMNATNSLFSSVTKEIIDSYTLTINKNYNNKENFISNISVNNNKIHFTLAKSPAIGTEIQIMFTLTKGQVQLTSVLKLYIKPDVGITTNYPKPNDDSKLESEYIYLNPSYVNGTSDYFSFAINQKAEFGKYNRVVANSVQQGVSVNTSRITYSIKNITKNNNTTNLEDIIFKLNNEIIDSTTNIPYASAITLQWASADFSNVIYNIEFSIKLDGEEFAQKYNIAVCSNVENVYTIGEVNHFEETQIIDNDKAEVFYVEKSTTETIFSYRTALLSFSTTNTNEKFSGAKTFTFFESTNLYNALGSINVSPNTTNYKIILTSITNIVNLSNLRIQVSGNTLTYNFNSKEDNLSIYNDYINLNTVTLKHRLNVLYNGQELSETNYENSIFVGSDSVSDYKIDKSISENISDTEPNEIVISIKNADNDNVDIATYKYMLKFDFKATDANKVEILTAGQSLCDGANEGILNYYGIQRLNGSSFSKEYFETHKVTIDAKVLMVTKKSDLSALFIDKTITNYANYVNKIDSNINPDLSYYDQNKWLGISKNNDNNSIYDFTFLALGAENNGNYAYVLITYGISEDANAQKYVIIKIEIEPDENSIRLFNDNNRTTSNGKNFDDTFKISYTSNTFAPIVLARNGNYKTNLNNGNYIYMPSPTDTNVNSALSNLIKFEIGGDLVNYIEAEKNSDTYIIKQKGTAVAMLGDKNGYIKISTECNYVKYFYITLKATSATYALKIADDTSTPYVNYINETYSTSFYSGKTFTIIPTDYSENLGDKGAIRINNLNLYNQGNYSYQSIKFNLSDYGDLPTINNNECILPIVNVSLETTMNIILEILDSKNNITEIVTLSYSIIIVERFINEENSANYYVREGITFNIADLIIVKDLQNENKLAKSQVGSTTLQSNTKTLIFNDADKGRSVTVSASDGTDSYEMNIKIGYDLNNYELTPINNKYYHTLCMYENSEFKNLNLNNFTISVSNSIAFESVNDAVVSIITTKNLDISQYIFVNTNDGQNTYKLKFLLNKDGLQSKSIYESILNGDLKTENGNNLTNGDLLIYTICNFQLNSVSVSAGDLQLLKNYKIFDDTIALKVINNASTEYDYNLKVRIEAENIDITSTYDIKNNLDCNHYYYLSVASCLKNNGITYDLSKTYKITLSYISNSSQDINLVKYNDEEFSRIYNGEYYTFTYIIQEFNFNEIALTNNIFAEKIDVLSAKEFIDNGNIINYTKYYIINYSSENLTKLMPLTYNVTPKYFDLSNNNAEQYVYVYKNQMQVSNQSGQNPVYTIPFETWASSIYLREKGTLSNKNLYAVSNDLSSLVFSLKSDLGGSGSGYFENGNLITKPGYDLSNYFIVAVEVLVNNNPNEKTLIGTIKVLPKHDLVTVAIKGTYTVIVTHAENAQSNVSLLTTHEFDENLTVNVSDILSRNNEDIADKINEKGEVNIGGSYYKTSTCNIEIVTAVNAVYTAVYNETNENIDIKLSINENASSIGKTFGIKVKAIKNSNIDIPIVSKTIDVLIGKAGDAYTLQPSVNGVDIGGTVVRGENSYFTISIPKDSLYADTFVGAECIYEPSIVSSSNIDLEYIYSDPINVNIPANATIFFKVEYRIQSQVNSVVKYVGLKNIATNKGVNGYAINVNVLTSDTISNYTITYVTNDSVSNYEEDASYYLLLNNSSLSNETFSMAYINSYKTNSAFVVELYMADSINSATKISIYTGTKVAVNSQPSKFLPSEVILKNLTPNTRYYLGIANKNYNNNMEVIGILSDSNGNITIDTSSFNMNEGLQINYLNTLKNSLNNITIVNGQTYYFSMFEGYDEFINTIYIKSEIYVVENDIYLFEKAVNVYNGVLKTNVMYIEDTTYELEYHNTYYITKKVGNSKTYEILYVNANEQTLSLETLLQTNDSFEISTDGFTMLINNQDISLKVSRMGGNKEYNFTFTGFDEDGEYNIQDGYDVGKINHNTTTMQFTLKTNTLTAYFVSVIVEEQEAIV